MNTYTIETSDFEEDQEVTMRLLLALVAALAKMKNSGMDNCEEYKNGVAMVSEWDAKEKKRIAKIEAAITEQEREFNKR